MYMNDNYLVEPPGFRGKYEYVFLSSKMCISNSDQT